MGVRVQVPSLAKCQPTLNLDVVDAEQVRSKGVNMIKKTLKEKVKLLQIDLFDPNRTYVNYSLISNTGESSITFNCVEKYSNVEIGKTFDTLIICRELPNTEEMPPILSMKVKLVSIGSSSDGSENFYRFEGISKPYSEVSICSKHIELENSGSLIGESFYIGVN